MHILIVEDSSFQRRNLKNILQNADYDVAEAEDGEKALQVISTQTPDCILLDLLMPGMDGFELLAVLAKQYPAIPTIVVTSDIQSSTGQQCKSLGAKAIINKPVKSHLLLSTLRKTIRAMDKQQSHELNTPKS